MHLGQLVHVIGERRAKALLGDANEDQVKFQTSGEVGRIATEGLEVI